MASGLAALGLHPGLGLLAAIAQHGRGKQPHGEPDQRGQQQDVIHIAQHGDEVGDQVDGAQGVGDHEGAQGLRACSH